MLIRRPDKMDGRAVTMEGVKDVSMRLLVGRDDGAPTFAMRHFTVAPGGNTPRHSHNYEHEVWVVSGSGQLECDGEINAIKGGDAILVEPNRTHQFVNDSEEPLVFLCLVPVKFNCTDGSCQATPGS